MTTSLSLRKRISGLLLAVLLIVPVSVTAFPRPAHAFLGFGDIVFDPIAYAKDLGLDNIGWMIAKTAIASMQRSLVNWINSGFDGSPAFASDLRQNLQGVGDAVIATVVSDLAGRATEGLIVNSPYQDEIATAIRTGYYLSTGGSFHVRNPFTLGNYTPDPRSYLAGDFSQGGLSAWHATITNCQNNPYCAYQEAAREVDNRLAAAGGQRITELNWGDGFMSFRGNCKPFANAQEAVAALNNTDNCVGKPIRTPGTVIASQLNQALPKGMEGLVTADEIDEVIGALLQQLVNKVIGNDGLLGLSSPASGGGRSFLDDATSQSQRPTQATIDPAIETKLSTYESSWKAIGDAADKALAKCPESSVARQALRDALTAQAQVDGARRALSQSGATVEMLGELMPTDAQIFNAQGQASGLEGTTLQQLQEIQSSRSCPQN